MKLETDRLILREFTSEDLEPFAVLMADPEVMRYSLNGPMNKEQAREYFQRRVLTHYDKYGFGLNAALTKSENRLIGFAGLISQVIQDENKVELSYRFHPDYWGKGLATEAALAVSQYAFEKLGIPELISIIDPKNERSLRLAKRVGMSLWKEAVFHNIAVLVYRLERNPSDTVSIRILQKSDIERLVQNFTFPWSQAETTRKLWEKNFKEQQEGVRTVCVLEGKKGLLGYGSLLKVSEYPFFRENHIPEVSSIWIDEGSRRKGFGKRLITHFEEMAIEEGYKKIGIGVGLYRDYGPAQKLYFKLGYAPDGNGVFYHDLPVVAGEKYPIDDNLILWLIKYF